MFDHPQFTELCYRGQKCTADISAALAYWGDVQIELIQQRKMMSRLHIATGRLRPWVVFITSE